MDGPGETIELLAVGDLQIMAHEPAADLFDAVDDILRRADIGFGNCEWPYSEEAGDTHPVEAHINDYFDEGDLFLPGKPEAVRMMGRRFDVMSVANNHTMHGGYRAFLRTLALLRESGITPVGGGAEIVEARAAAIIERGGRKIAFLACTSGFLPGAHAGRRTPGIVPLRRHTYVENPAWEQWGIEPDMRALINREDLTAICTSIAEVRAQVDVVVMSCHWGVLEHAYAIGEFQREAARAFIDAGVDLIVGHGPLALKGFEVYRGRVVLYSLGKFMMISQWKMDTLPTGISAPLIDEARKGLAVSIKITQGHIDGVTFVPVFADAQGRPAFPARDDPNFSMIIGEVVDKCRLAGLNGTVDADGRVILT